jgi:cysteine desulfurase/selenocysteine lyase
MLKSKAFDPEKIKSDFPIFNRKVRGNNRLIYLDSAATSQKPKSVIAAEAKFYELINGAANRGAHLLAEEASLAYEQARQRVAKFINAKSQEVIFTKSATESLNGLAYSLGNRESKFHVKPGDEILVSEMEHHANLIPWQQLANRNKAKLRWIEVDKNGELILDSIDKLINAKTKVVALTHQSNVLGTIPPIDKLNKLAKANGALFILDACQSAPHFPIDVQALNVDAIAFSGHKIFGPTGIGVLWAKTELLEKIEPFIYGGSMIDDVSMESATWADLPRKFEAGVPNMAQAVGLAAALDYVDEIGMKNIENHELTLTQQFISEVSHLNEVSIIGPTEMKSRGSVVSFTISGVHPHDAGQVLDQYGIAVRTGHHCAWPLMRKLNLVGTVRASFAAYNTEQDVDDLIKGIIAVQDYFRVR